jgi:capsular exopolysaccharide synthesis family protein
MSNIEKALKKTKQEIKKAELPDKNQPGVDSKSKAESPPSQNVAASESGGPIQDSLKLSDLESSSGSKLDNSDNHILSAIEKKKDENRTDYSPLISADNDQLLEGSRFVSHIKDSSSKKVKTESVIPVTRVSNFDVDDHIVSYYETVGKQTWKGPVMVNFRRLQVSLSGLQRNNMCKVMLFTSSQQQEGKSTIALNTAITLCSDKKAKVAIVDCDFRKPSLDKLLGFSPEKGLSDHLLGEADFKDICFDGLFPNLVLIPAGNKPSNTFELFSSEGMRQVVSCLREKCDYVIIDSPPVLAFPDTVILAPMTDGVVFVVNGEITKKKIAKRAVETLKDCKIAGFVMNMSKTASADYYGHTSGNDYYDYASS